MFEKIFHNHLVLVAFSAGVFANTGVRLIIQAANNDWIIVGLLLVLTAACVLYKTTTIHMGLRGCIEAVINTLPKEKFEKILTDYYTQPKKGD